MEKAEVFKARKCFLESVSYSHVLREFITNEDVRNFIACQFALESNFGCSALARRRYNFCGMKLPKSRLFYGYECSDSFAKYNSLNDCVKDYVSWVLYNRPSRGVVSSVDCYSNWLESKGYCPEKDYVDKIRVIYNQYYS